MNNNNKNNKINETIKLAESKYKWMKIRKHNGRYVIEDTRFKPYSITKSNLTESELLGELKPYLI